MRKRNEQIEKRIMDEILVDCYGEEEQITSWYYYITDEIEFPFEAEIKVKKIDRKEEYKKVTVIDISSDSMNNLSIEAEIEFDNYIIEIPLEKLEKIESTERNIQIVNDWKYWKIK